ncbi:MAG: ABC transporter transmembrane domain-containing protein [Beijerinckiaceae bacterium]
MNATANNSKKAEGGQPRAEKAPLRALKPLLPYGWRYRGRALAALAALVVASIATLTVPVAVRGMIDHGFSADGAGLIDRYFGVMIAVVAVLALASAARYFLVITLGERVVADLRKDVFGHLSTLDAEFYDTARTGELVSRLTADTTQLKAAFGSSASVALRNLFMFCGAIAMMVYTSPKLSGLVLIAIPVIVLPLVAAGRGVRARSRRAQDTLAEASAYAAENLSSVRTMQAFNAEAPTRARFAQAVEEAFEAARSTTAMRAIVTMIAIFLAFSSVVGVLWLGAQDVLAGHITGGLLSQFVLYAVFGARSLGQLSEVWNEISHAAGAAGRIAEILDVKPKIAEPAVPASLPEPPRGEIAFEGVRFAYPARPGEPAVDGLSFSVRSGETVAIVGPSGAGKSTIFQLLTRFYDPQAGRILVDGIEICSASPSALRRRIAMVPQEPAIFGTSISENILYGRMDASRAQVEDAARRAQAEQFIANLPEGYATKVGERGITLSGGQKQRLAIARAILKDAPILLLDEATSALDAENEKLVQKALEDLMGTRTTLVIAHRLATVLKADRILVMDAGRIVEEGTHASLTAAGGLYARLARLQFDTGREVEAAGE